jgi:hypothetical protein
MLLLLVGVILFLVLELRNANNNITPINQFTAPTGTQLEPPKSSKPIHISGYELCPSLINLV